MDSILSISSVPSFEDIIAIITEPSVDIDPVFPNDINISIEELNKRQFAYDSLLRLYISGSDVKNSITTQTLGSSTMNRFINCIHFDIMLNSNNREYEIILMEVLIWAWNRIDNWNASTIESTRTSLLAKLIIKRLNNVVVECQDSASFTSNQRFLHLLLNAVITINHSCPQIIGEVMFDISESMSQLVAFVINLWLNQSDLLIINVTDILRLILPMIEIISNHFGNNDQNENNVLKNRVKFCQLISLLLIQVFLFVLLVQIKQLLIVIESLGITTVQKMTYQLRILIPNFLLLLVRCSKQSISITFPSSDSPTLQSPSCYMRAYKNNELFLYDEIILGAWRWLLTLSFGLASDHLDTDQIETIHYLNDKLSVTLTKLVNRCIESTVSPSKESKKTIASDSKSDKTKELLHLVLQTPNHPNSGLFSTVLQIYQRKMAASSSELQYTHFVAKEIGKSYLSLANALVRHNKTWVKLKAIILLLYRCLDLHISAWEKYLCMDIEFRNDEVNSDFEASFATGIEALVVLCRYCGTNGSQLLAIALAAKQDGVAAVTTLSLIERLINLVSTANQKNRNVMSNNSLEVAIKCISGLVSAYIITPALPNDAIDSPVRGQLPNQFSGEHPPQYNITLVGLFQRNVTSSSNIDLTTDELMSLIDLISRSFVALNDNMKNYSQMLTQSTTSWQITVSLLGRKLIASQKYERGKLSMLSSQIDVFSQQRHRGSQIVQDDGLVLTYDGGYEHEVVSHVSELISKASGEVFTAALKVWHGQWICNHMTSLCNDVEILRYQCREAFIESLIWLSHRLSAFSSPIALNVSIREHCKLFDPSTSMYEILLPRGVIALLEDNFISTMAVMSVIHYLLSYRLSDERVNELYSSSDSIVLRSVVRSMKSIIESASLPNLLAILSRIVIGHTNGCDNSSEMVHEEKFQKTSIYRSDILHRFIARVFSAASQNIAQLEPPSPSDVLSQDLLLSTINGISSLVRAPLLCISNGSLLHLHHYFSSASESQSSSVCITDWKKLTVALISLWDHHLSEDLRANTNSMLGIANIPQMSAMDASTTNISPLLFSNLKLALDLLANLLKESKGKYESGLLVLQLYVRIVAAFTLALKFQFTNNDELNDVYIDDCNSLYKRLLEFSFVESLDQSEDMTLTVSKMMSTFPNSKIHDDSADSSSYNTYKGSITEIILRVHLDWTADIYVSAVLKNYDISSNVIINLVNMIKPWYSEVFFYHTVHAPHKSKSGGYKKILSKSLLETRSRLLSDEKKSNEKKDALLFIEQTLLDYQQKPSTHPSTNTPSKHYSSDVQPSSSTKRSFAFTIDRNAKEESIHISGSKQSVSNSLSSSKYVKIPIQKNDSLLSSSIIDSRDESDQRETKRLKQGAIPLTYTRLDRENNDAIASQAVGSQYTETRIRSNDILERLPNDSREEYVSFASIKSTVDSSAHDFDGIGAKANIYEELENNLKHRGELDNEEDSPEPIADPQSHIPNLSLADDSHGQSSEKGISSSSRNINNNSAVLQAVEDDKMPHEVAIAKPNVGLGSRDLVRMSTSAMRSSTRADILKYVTHCIDEASRTLSKKWNSNSHSTQSQFLDSQSAGPLELTREEEILTIKALAASQTLAGKLLALHPATET